MTSKASPSAPENGILSESTVVAIFETYLRLHGPCTEARLVAVLKTAERAAVSLTLFQMTMHGAVIPVQNETDIVFESAQNSTNTTEHVSDILQRVLREVGVSPRKTKNQPFPFEGVPA